MEKRYEHPDVGGISMRGRNGSPSRQGCVNNCRTTTASNKRAHPPLTYSPLMNVPVPSAEAAAIRHHRHPHHVPVPRWTNRRAAPPTNRQAVRSMSPWKSRCFCDPPNSLSAAPCYPHRMSFFSAPPCRYYLRYFAGGDHRFLPAARYHRCRHRYFGAYFWSGKCCHRNAVVP